MVKNILRFIFSFIIILSSICFASESVNINSKVILMGERCYLPADEVFKELNFNMVWDKGEKLFIVTNDSSIIKIMPNNIIISKDDLNIKLPAPPILIDNELYVPSELFADVFGGYYNCNHKNLNVDMCITFENDKYIYDNITNINETMKKLEDIYNVRCFPVALNSYISEIIPTDFLSKYYAFEVICVSDSDNYDLSPDYLICVDKTTNEIFHLYPDSELISTQKYLK